MSAKPQQSKKVVRMPLEDKEPKRLRFFRHFTSDGRPPLDEVKWEKRRSVITEPDGTVVFEMKDVDVPASWSMLATDIAVSKYFCKAGVPGEGTETSVRQLVRRVAHTIAEQGGQCDIFHSDHDECIFEEELTYLLVNQHGAFNSPVWFNCGLHHSYGISGSPGNYHWDEYQQEAVCIEDSYANPQCSACFIQRVEDDLRSIFELLGKEARVFKFGSGTGTNFSKLRSSHEHLSGGGTSSGLLSFLEVFDKGAGATKSGGTTRRAAKMVCLDMDHPEIEEFIGWKVAEEKKAHILISQGMNPDAHGGAYHTVSGQNSNNSVRMNDAFMKAYQKNENWQTRLRTTDDIHKTYQARELMRSVAQAAWVCGDPGVQFDTTINNWHTCPKTDRIYASNPCSEFMFLDDTACNLASINLLHFYNTKTGEFDLKGLRHAVRVFATAMEILVDFSSYPTADIATNSHKYRPLGLGYANLGTLLMSQGLSYDSEESRSIAAAITAIVSGEAYAVSAELASVRGAFEGFRDNRQPMMQVINKHRKAVDKINSQTCPALLLEAAQQAWERADIMGKSHGYRNSQMTVLAPTGTIGLLMDCDTTGIEPDFALVKWKKLAGGGYIKIVNQSVSGTLEGLGYSKEHIDEMITHVLGTASLTSFWSNDKLQEMGFTKDEISEAEKSIFSNNNWSDFTPHISPSSLKERKVSDDNIQAALMRINGSETIETAPHISEDHIPIFDCANRCGKHGKRFLKPMAHIKMMAAVQPFISGAISKTVNVPNETTVEEIENLYVQAWKYGIKSVAVYRDGSKSSQPLSTNGIDAKNNGSDSEMLRELQTDWGSRRKMPRERKGTTLEAQVAGHKLFLRTGEYENDKLGEIFIDMYKEGAAYRSMMNSFAQAISVGLQYGVPLEKYVQMFCFTRFDPCGFTDHPDVHNATSILDFIFRILAIKYLGRRDFVQNIPQVVMGGSEASALSNTSSATSNLNQQMGEIMGDAPICDNCGHLTVRNGACYRCLNCGNSLGCS